MEQQGAVKMSPKAVGGLLALVSMFHPRVTPVLRQSSSLLQDAPSHDRMAEFSSRGEVIDSTSPRPCLVCSQEVGMSECRQRAAPSPPPRALHPAGTFLGVPDMPLLGLGLAALGRPGYINLGHGADLTGGATRPRFGLIWLVCTALGWAPLQHSERPPPRCHPQARAWTRCAPTAPRCCRRRLAWASGGAAGARLATQPPPAHPATSRQLDNQPTNQPTNQESHAYRHPRLAPAGLAAASSLPKPATLSA